MATLNQSYSGLFQAYPVEFLRSPDNCSERPNQADIVGNQSHFVVTGVGLNGTSMAGHRNGHHGFFDLQNNRNPATFVGDTNSEDHHLRLGVFPNYDGMRRFPTQSCKENSIVYGRKHKREDQDHEDDDYPASKKRLTEAACLPLIPTVDFWGSCTSGEVGNCLNLCKDGTHSTTSMLDSQCEEMEQAVCDQQSDHASSTLQEIEDRLTDEEEVETDNHINLPRLVFSDTLKAELKRGFDDALTKKIVQSLSPPSMELVLWKPPPVFADTWKTVCKEFKQAADNGTPSPPTMDTVFLQQIENSSVPPNPTCSNVALAWSTDEEMEQEMEL